MTSLGMRIKTARENIGMSQSELAVAIGVKPASGVISNWERDLNKPDAEKIVKLCEVLDISASFLLDYYGKSTFEVKSSEMEHIKKYRALDPAGQSHVDSILDWETVRITALKEKDKRITELEARPATIIELDARSGLHHLAEYFHDASAGGGIFILGNEATSKIAVSDSDWDERTDYVIRVNGDSMMPDYIDGDNVMVSQHTELNYGDVGIFVINGKAYIKEYSEAELISRNPKSPNIPIHEFDNIVCMGKVIGKLKGGYKIIGG